jgi:simple sugar transport system ATP-binding protein
MSGWCWLSRRTRIPSSAICDDPRYLKGPFLNIDAIMADAKDKIEKYDIRPGNPRLKTANFSGGNQQKIVLAREMEQDPGVLIVGQPTRGVDVGAMSSSTSGPSPCDQGKAVLVVSVELDEIRSLSDRILVMFAAASSASAARGDRGELRPADGGVERQEATQ